MGTEQPVKVRVQSVFVLALAWSIGGPLHDEDRVRFDGWLRSQLDVAKISVIFVDAI